MGGGLRRDLPSEFRSLMDCVREWDWKVEDIIGKFLLGERLRVFVAFEGIGV